MASAGFLVAQDGIQLDSRITIVGPVWSASSLYLQPDVNVQAAVVATGNVTLTDRDTVTSITYGGTLTTGNGDSIGTSTRTTLTNTARSTSVTFPAATQSITLNSGQSTTLGPGSYVGVTANSGATLTLLDGDYYFGSLVLESASVLRLSPSQGATRIFISSTFAYRPTLGSGADASRLFVEYLGTNAVVLETRFWGSIVVPHASLAIGTASSQTHRGSFIARSLEVQPDAKLAFVAFNPSGTVSSCAAGTWDPDGNPFTPCVAKTTCAPGSYVSSQGTTTSDRTCAACTSGQFSTVNNAPSCTAWTTCQAGTYLSNTPSSTVDRVCIACPGGQYSSGNNQSQCLPQGVCAAGTVQTAAGTTTSATVCTPCVAGQYCAGGTSPQTTCVAGTWDNDANPGTVCVAKTTCLAGSYVTNEGTTTTDRTCAACASGSFSTTANAAVCTTWTTCLAGSYVTNTPSSTVDRVCEACPSGQYSANNNQASCQPQGTCAAGTEQTASGTSTSDTVCTPCVAGQYCAGGAAEPVTCEAGTWDNDLSAATPCVAKTSCLPGTLVDSEGTATIDRACAACVSGSFSTTSNAAACDAWSTCVAGTFVSNTPSSTVDRVCVACPSGQYSSSSNQSQCLPQGSCAAGTLQTAAGTATSAAVCEACAAGQYCAGGTSPATTCGDGTWDDDSNPATACAPASVCAPGTRVLAEATSTTDRICQACEAGTFSTTANATSCAAWATCDPGTYVSNAPSSTADRVCSACEIGRYSSDPNAPACTVWTTCSAGFYVGNTPSAITDRQCIPCEADQYSSGDNQSSCLPQGSCAAGWVQVTAGTPTSPTVCNPCVAGEYCAGGVSPEVPCAYGTWDHDADAATACVDKSVCPAGTFLASEGTTTTDRSCTACGNEHFSTEPNSASCSPWTTCPAGTFVSNTPSTTVDRVCAPCAANTFSNASNAAACTPVSICPAGTFVSTPASASSDVVCTECAPGTFSGTTNAPQCEPCACNDGLPCTTASCNSVGTCTYSPTAGNCAIDGTCYTEGAANPANDCQRCAPSTSQTTWSLQPDGATCNDGDPCTSGDVCAAGVCGGTQHTCDDGLACTTDICNGDGTCSFSPNPGACVIDGACYTAGDGNPANQCQQCLASASQTAWSPKPDGLSCSDGSACTQTDTCQAGVCTGSNPVLCAALDQCHDPGACDPSTGQCSNPAKTNGTSCNDGNACTQIDQCEGGLCVGSSPVACAALDQCHVAGSCDPSSGLCSNPPVAEGIACEDGDSCTTGDSCHAGTCTPGAPVTCVASDACHVVGICNPATGFCSNPTAPDGTTCSDNNPCTRTDTCQAGSCLGSDPVTCTALDQCHAAGTCDTATGACTNPIKSNGALCSDDNACTQGDTCQAGACAGGTPVACTALDQCHVAGTCDTATGTCSNPLKDNGSACDDGNRCTTGDTCQSGSCAAGTPVTCTALDACHVAGTCNPSTGACTNPNAANGTACNDNNGCTTADQCQNGTCAGSNPVTCLAADQCHLAGTCVPATGSCSYARKANGTTCSDGNACTQTDTCQAGICVGSNPKTCPQGNQCQEAGQCDPTSGDCLFPGKADGIACDDGDATTSDDACHAGVCLGIPPVPAPTATNLASSLAFIYQGPGASQTGVPANTIQTFRAAGVRGHVFTRDGSGLMGVTITVLGRVTWGRTLSRADGGYDLVVNGGLVLTIVLTKAGYLPVDRQVDVPWQGFADVPDVVMVPVDAQVSTIDLTQPTQQVAVGSVSTDQDGTRQAVLVVPAGTQAMMDLPDGTTVGLDTLNVHITEVTQGSTGPAAMPAPLPGNTQYTYAVDYSTDEGLAANAKLLRFSKPIYHYSENFLGFAVGTGIPAGYYDRNLHAWVPTQNGAVVKILSVSNGLAQLDVNGSGSPAPSDWKQAMGITDAELGYLAERYQPGQTLWRVPVPHFTFWDYNHCGGPPPDATGPQCSVPSPPAGPSDPICGSIIEAQNQIVGERIPITGTPFTLNYRSNRVEGFKAAYHLDIGLSGASVPESLLNIRLTANIAGQRFEDSFAPAANLFYALDWNGRDAAGRPVNGQQVAHVSVAYEYPVHYYYPGDALYHAAVDFGKLGANIDRTLAPSSERTFGPRALAAMVIGPETVPGREQMIIWQDMTPVVGTYLANSTKMGAWTLDVNHTFDFQHTLWRGDGERQTSPVSLAALGEYVVTYYSGSLRIATSADGALYITGATPGTNVPPGGLSTGTIRRIDPGTGNHSDFFTLAQVPAVENPAGWGTRRILALATAPDNSVYLSADAGYSWLTERYIDHVGPTGTFIESWKVIDVSGSGNVQAIAISKDGTVYYADVRADNFCVRLWRLTRDGQKSQVAGGNCANLVASGDGGAAINATFKAAVDNIGWLTAVDLAIGPDGSIYIANQTECRVRRIGLDGIISTVAGTTCPSAGQHTGDGGPATAAKINPTSLVVGPGNELYIGDSDYWEIDCPVRQTGCTDWGSGSIMQPRGRIRMVKDGVIDSIAGAPVIWAPQGSPALKISLGTLNDLALRNDSLWYVESATGNIDGATSQKPASFPNAVRRVSALLQGPTGTASWTFRISSQDGGEIYEFDGNGVHLRTLDALTGAVRYQFGYDPNGLLTSVTDANNLVTSIVRDGSGNATAIVAPSGQQTVLGYGDDGYLAALDQPGDIHHEFTYHPGGLLHTFQNPNGNVSTFSYDDLGRVTGEQMPGGCSWTLTRTGPAAGNIKAPVRVAVTSAEGRTRSYTVGKDDNGTENRTNLSAAGLATTTSKTQAAVETQTTPDGMMSTVTSGPDPRGGMQAPIPLSTVVRTPSGKQMTVNMSRSATTDSTGQTLVSQVDTTTLNGKASTSTYSAAGKTITNVSPMGRQTVTTLDAQGRVVKVQAGNLAPTAYAYDARGRLSSVTVGTGATARVTNFGYDDLDRLSTVTDPQSRVQSYTYDDANRVVGQTFADGSEVGFSYDPNGNVTSVTPPGRPVHAFGFTPADLMSSYTPPVVSGAGATTYEYNLDKQPTVIHRPDGSTINFTYDSAGRLATTTYPSVNGNVTVTRAYSPTTGKLSGMTTSDGQSLAFGFDGRLPTSTTWAGSVAGSVSRTYNNDFRLASESVNGANSVAFGYDNDGLLTSVDGLTFTHDPSNGSITDTTLGQVTDHRTYDGFGNPATYEAKFGTTSLYSVSYVPDSLGRIAQKTETVQGTTTIWSYSYDQAGNIWQVMQNGTLTATYGYDSNGNRNSVATPGGTQTASYDAQDRLLTYGKWTYTYTPNGNLQTKTDTTTGEVTSYAYDAQGNLRHVDLPDGRAIDYVIDSRNRRVAKKVNGAVVRKWLYRDQLKPAAEFDGAGTLLARYLDGVTIKGSSSYRVVADHLGTPRLLVHSTSGAIAQRLDFDEWGQVTADTSAGFQAFGFAGGIYDPDTGLVRFGARDYDPVVGRWTAKDPIRFEGGQGSFYVYLANEPIASRDPTGLDVWLCRQPTGIVLTPFMKKWADRFNVDLNHYWVKTDTKEFGMGPADPNAPQSYGQPTKQTDQTGSSTNAAAVCEKQPRVDEACVNSFSNPGQDTGAWTWPINYCKPYAENIIDYCTVGSDNLSSPTSDGAGNSL
jgi:RHS repeat-associated protein